MTRYTLAIRPVTLIILLITFGTMVAAGLPLLVGITAVMAALGLVEIPSSLLPVASRSVWTVVEIPYLPGWLEWLPRVGPKGDAAPPVGPREPPIPDEPDSERDPRPAPVPA